VRGRKKSRDVIQIRSRLYQIIMAIILCNSFNTFTRYFFRNLAKDHESVLRCLRSKSTAQLASFSPSSSPSFLASIGPSKDGVLIANDFAEGTNGVANGKKRASGGNPVNYTVVLGLVEDEAKDVFFAEQEVAEGIGPDTRDRYFRSDIHQFIIGDYKQQNVI
jgi:hypothetical protein